MTARTRRRPLKRGTGLVMLGLFVLIALTLFKASKERGAEAVQEIAGTLGKGALAAVAAAFATRFVLLRLGLLFMAPPVAAVVAVAAFMAVGAWDISAGELGLPRAPGALTGGAANTGGDEIPGGTGELPPCDGVRWYDYNANVWRCRPRAS